MSVYTYKALDVDASAVAGTVAADTAGQARQMLRERGLTVTGIAQTATGGSSVVLFWRGLLARRCRQEVSQFIGELATLLGAGIPLLSALQTLAGQHSGRLAPVIQALADDVASGVPLAEAMGRRVEWFDDTAVSIVRVGENTGSLEQALERLAEFRAKAHRLRGRIATALIYPAIVGTIGLAVAVFLMTHVVPDLIAALNEAGRPLPAVTRVVKAASDFLVGWWWLLVVAAGALAAGAVLLARSRAGAALLDRLTLALPLVGDLVRKETTSRIAVVMAALLRSGLQFVEAVGIARRTVGNGVFRGALEEYERAVTAGRDVAGPLKSSGVFSPMVVQMLAVGQQAGRLEEMLDRLAASYDAEVAVAAQRLTAALEPLVIVLLAVVVGAIAFAAILPILEVSNVMQ